MRSDESFFLRHGQGTPGGVAGREARLVQRPVPGEPHGGTSEPGSDERLDSWKQIATYLGRSVRTGRRWEKEEGLPVRRHVHDKGDSVYAFKTELDVWRSSQGSKAGG